MFDSPISGTNKKNQNNKKIKKNHQSGDHISVITDTKNAPGTNLLLSLEHNNSETSKKI